MVFIKAQAAAGLETIEDPIAVVTTVCETAAADAAIACVDGFPCWRLKE